MEEYRRTDDRLRPFWTQTHALLRSDPTFESDEERERARQENVYRRVTEVMHFMKENRKVFTEKKELKRLLEGNAKLAAKFVFVLAKD